MGAVRGAAAGSGRRGGGGAAPTGAWWAVKGVLDRLAAAVLILAGAPVLLAVALAVRLSGPGPVLVGRRRVGKDGRVFTAWRFRTTAVGEAAGRAELSGDGAAVPFRVGGDPRLTAVGGWLRRRSLDELPQLFNVVRGDMSLVGPRPAPPEEALCQGEAGRRRLAVRPGMTGLWQVDGRSALSWEESVRLDLRYVETASLMLDLRILWKTCSAVARGAGTY